MARNRYSDEKVLVTANNAKLIAEGVYKIAAEFERLSGLMGEFKSGGVEARRTSSWRQVPFIGVVRIVRADCSFGEDCDGWIVNSGHCASTARKFF